jgi:hypothetical protein
MANYYWTGSQDSDLNNRFNWTLWNTFSGISFSGTGGYLAASQKPNWGDRIIFKNMGVPSGAVVNYPIYPPGGTLTGNTTSPGSTAGVRYVSAVTIDGSYNLPFGGATAPVTLYSGLVQIYKNQNTTGFTAMYLNVPDVGGITTANIQLSSFNTNSINYYFNGGGKLTLLGSTAGSPDVARGNIYLYNFTVDNLTTEANVNSQVIFMDSTTSLPSKQNEITGSDLSLRIKKGFSISDGSLLLRANGSAGPSLFLVEEGVTGSTGPSYVVPSTLELTTIGTEATKPYVDVQHGVYFNRLDIGGGYVNLRPQGDNDTVVVRQGQLLGDKSKVIIDSYNAVTMLAAAGAYQGFSVQNFSPTNPPIQYSGNYRITLLPEEVNIWGSTGS